MPSDYEDSRMDGIMDFAFIALLILTAVSSAAFCVFLSFSFDNFFAKGAIIGFALCVFFVVFKMLTGKQDATNLMET